jgi:flavorubredoxin
LVARGVTVHPFDLTVVDLGRLATVLVDAATLVVGTPVVNAAPHPAALYAASLVNVLRPKLKFVTLVGSYGWSGKVLESLPAAMPNVKAEVLPPVLCRGLPQPADYQAVAVLADQIANRHRALNLT